MTPDSDYLLLQVKTVDGVTVAKITTPDLWSEKLIGGLSAELMHLTDDLGSPKLVLDFAGVTGLGSRMIGQLASLHKQIKAAGGRLALCNVCPDIAEVIETCKLTTLFGMYPDEQTAVRSFAD